MSRAEQTLAELGKRTGQLVRAEVEPLREMIADLKKNVGKTISKEDATEMEHRLRAKIARIELRAETDQNSLAAKAATAAACRSELRATLAAWS